MAHSIATILCRCGCRVRFGETEQAVRCGKCGTIVRGANASVIKSTAVEQGSSEWFKARCGRITGTRFANAMSGRGTKSYRSLVDVLVDERLHQLVDKSYTSAAMQWGMDHEDAARHWYSRTRNRAVTSVGFVVHPQFDYVGVSPDGLVDHDGLVEIKCPQLPNFQKVALSRQLPSQYRWQVQGQLWVCQRRWLDFVCFYPPGEGVIVPITANSEDAACLAERCREIHLEVERAVGARAKIFRPRAAAKPASATVLPSPIAPSPTRSEPRPPANAPAGNKGMPGWVWVLIVVIVLVLLNHWGMT